MHESTGPAAHENKRRDIIVDGPADNLIGHAEHDPTKGVAPADKTLKLRGRPPMTYDVPT